MKMAFETPCSAPNFASPRAARLAVLSRSTLVPRASAIARRDGHARHPGRMPSDPTCPETVSIGAGRPRPTARISEVEWPLWSTSSMHEPGPLRHPLVGRVVGRQRHPLLAQDLGAAGAQGDPDVAVAEDDRGDEAVGGRDRHLHRPATVADARGELHGAGRVELLDEVGDGRRAQPGDAGDLDLGQRAVLAHGIQDPQAVHLAQRGLRARGRTR